MNKLAIGMLLSCVSGLLSPLAWADEPAASKPSVSAIGLFELPDNARDSDDGVGGSLSFYLPLTSRTGEGLEFDFYGVKRDTDAGSSDSQLGLFVNYTKSFGVYGWDGEAGFEQYLPPFSPYVLAGVGVVRDVVATGDHYAPGLNLGAGISFPIGASGMALRTETRIVGQVNDESVPGEDYLVDVQFRVGLSIPLGEAAASPGDPAPAEECGVAVVDPITGRKDCSVDSDRDGIDDNADLCPGTPSGTPVDLNGCTATPNPDADGDGVPDEADTCPDTQSGVTVDMSGCVLPQGEGATPPPADAKRVVLSNVRFEMNSADLTAQAKDVLDQAAQGLSAETEIVVEVAGHTDGAGRGNYNLMLSLLRAENVRQYLISKGISRYRLFVEGYGETRPVGPNDTAEGRAANRRVDLDKLDVKVIESK